MRTNLHPWRQTPFGRRQAGLSIVELMVGMVVGLIVVGAALLMIASMTGESKSVILQARLSQDMRAAMDLIVRDIRRAGYWYNAEDGAWLTGSTTVATTYGSTGYGTVTSSGGTAMTYAYSSPSRTSPVSTVPSSEQYGVRLNTSTKAVEMQVAGGTYQAITDPSTTSITSLALTLNTSSLTVSCRSACPVSPGYTCPPTVSVRTVDISMTGQAANDASVVRTLAEKVRLRNDLIDGSCPP